VKSSPALIIQSLRKSFKDRVVLRDIDLALQGGQLTVLIGRSGSGKSTLLRCLSGLEKPDSGAIELAGQRSGMVFQQFHLFPHLNILDNLQLAPRVAHGRGDAEGLEQDCLGLLKKVGLATHAQHFPSQLSGGQQQRAAIARALACRPDVLLYDEPTSALDPHLAAEVLHVMAQLRKDGLTQVLVTHELDFAKRYADHVVFLEDGVVVEQGPPKTFFSKPKDARTKRFLKAAA
jgi:ABC-type polar amino acid transport system ATPase subunit